MPTKMFHVGDVLSIITRRLVSPRGLDGLYDILNFMTSEKFNAQRNVTSVEVSHAIEVCAPCLSKQFPQLNSGEMQFALGELILMLEGCKKEDKNSLIMGWLSKLTCGKYGIEISEMLEVHSIYEYRKPAGKSAEIAGNPN